MARTEAARADVARTKDLKGITMTEPDFAIEHEIVAKRDQLDELASRHNQLCALVPKQLTQDVVPEMQMALAEIATNETKLLAVMVELKNLCEKSPFFQRQQSAEVSDAAKAQQ
jgi:hypothetical protein